MEIFTSTETTVSVQNKRFITQKNYDLSPIRKTDLMVRSLSQRTMTFYYNLTYSTYFFSSW